MTNIIYYNFNKYNLEKEEKIQIEKFIKNLYNILKSESKSRPQIPTIFVFRQKEDENILKFYNYLKFIDKKPNKTICKKYIKLIFSNYIDLIFNNIIIDIKSKLIKLN